MPIVKQKSKVFYQSWERPASDRKALAFTGWGSRKIPAGAIASFFGAIVANFYYYRKQAKLKTVIITVLERNEPRNSLLTTTYYSN
ncbi:hypothetical protein C7B79_01785 [Chroococcidiopsis cubana CCALA 043]|nr:hypothetical protein C7B79_01785 [Chroococcidiopsis cubana CCALA 043]